MRALFRSGKRLAKPRRVVRFEQIIDGVHLECSHRVLIERGDEHGCRRRLTGDRAENLESVEIWHLHVEKEQIRLKRDDLLDGLSPTGACGDDFRGACFFDESHEALARDFFVVGNDGSQHVRHSG